MLLWIVVAFMTAAVAAAIARALLRTNVSRDARKAGRLNVYRAQLDELDADRARGAISDTEAEGIRAETARRMLAATDGSAPAARQDHRGRHVAGALLVAIPVFALGLYLASGSPSLPDQPLSARLQISPQDLRVAQLVERVEARLQLRPDEGRGWDVIAPVYLRLGRFDDAAGAFSRAAALLGDTPKRLLGKGEALVFAANGVVTDAALEAFEGVLKLAPGHPRARFWKALALDQDGKAAEAREVFLSLARGVRDASPLMRLLVQRLTVEEINAARRGTPGASTRSEPAVTGRVPAVDAEKREAVARLGEKDQRARINQMVDGLAARLAEGDGSLAEWARLIRSYAVLGRTDEANAALGKATRLFAGREEDLTRLRALAAQFKLEAPS